MAKEISHLEHDANTLGDVQALAYADLSGFSNFVKSDLNAATGLLSDFYNFAQGLKIRNDFGDIFIILYSDSIMIFGPKIADVVNYTALLFRECLRYNANPDRFPLVPRGGIASGSVILQERFEAPRVTKKFVVSPALVHAVGIERLIDGQRLLISASEQEENEHFWNRDIKAILYDQPRIKSGNTGYRYQDILWPCDLGLNKHDARQQTRELIEIAAALFRRFYGSKASVHYAETLRICLVSYAHLLEPIHDDLFIQEIVNNTLLRFPSEATWLGFLEMVFTSPDDWHYQINDGIHLFFKRALLDPIWGKVNNSLALSENGALKAHVQEMIEVVFDRMPRLADLDTKH